MRLTFSELATIVGEDFLFLNGFKPVEKPYIRTVHEDKPNTYNQAEIVRAKIKAPDVKKDFFVGEQEVEIQKRDAKGKKVGKKKKTMMSYSKKVELKDYPKKPFIKLLCKLHNQGLNQLYAIDCIFRFLEDQKDEEPDPIQAIQQLAQGQQPPEPEKKLTCTTLFAEVQAFKEYELEGITRRQWKDSVIENKKKIEFLNSLGS
jgi:hypothetical protein